METKNLTFADRFSHIKPKVLIILWIILLYFFYTSCYSTITAVIAITKGQESFYSVTVNDDRAEYTRVNSMPLHWVPLNLISKKIQGAIISSEDGAFYLHPGYDLEQLRKAIYDSFVKKKKMRGASTITQQLVKNLFLNKEKTFGRKIQELIMAQMLEKYTDKKKILETYLNIIEYGKGIFGIEAATNYYFKKKPAQVSAREAAFLAMLLPSPKKYSRSFVKKSLTPFANRMIESILLKMKQGGYIGEEEYLNELGAHFSWEQVKMDPSEKMSNESSEEIFEEGSESEE